MWIFSGPINAPVPTKFHVVVDKVTLLLKNIVFVFFLQASLNEWTYMTGFLCSLGGVCLTSLQTIRYCFIHSCFVCEIMFKVPLT